MTMRLAALVLALAVLGATMAGTALAGPAPDAVQIAWMREVVGGSAVGGAPLVRMRGVFGEQTAVQPWLDSSGVRIAARLTGKRPVMRTQVAALSADDLIAAGRDKLVSWQEISSLTCEWPNSAGKSAIVGGAMGAIMGVLIAYGHVDLFGSRLTKHGNKVVAGWAGAGMLLGFVTGLPDRSRVIYPPPAIEPR